MINEVLASNRTTSCTQDGRFEDWIEVKNMGTGPVNLAGYGLSDDPAAPFKWTFPGRILLPGELLVVWASGEDRRDDVDLPGLRREVYRNMSGGSASVLDRWDNFPDFPDETEILTEAFDAPRDVEDDYAQRISGFLEPAVTGSYRFWISSDNGGELFVSPDDDPVHARRIASVPDEASTPYDGWQAFPSQQSAPISLEAGKKYYVAATMKESYGGDHLRVRWQREGGTPEVIPASRFLARRAELHANFKISASGESIRLTRPDGGVADSIPAVALPADVSFGRPASAPATFRYFDRPTRGAENATRGFAEILRGTPAFSHSAGFYDEGFSLTLSTAETGATIIYTLDGSTPDPANLAGKTYSYRTAYPFGPSLEAEIRTLLYTAPIAIADRSSAINRLSGRAGTTWSGMDYLPSKPVFKGAVVRARLVKDGALPGPVVTNTYFAASGAKMRYQLPVISLSFDEDDLFDYTRGIHTPGEEFDRWRTYSGWDGDGGSPANYHRRGKSWERPVTFELFVPRQGRAFAQNLGVRLHGGWSRASAQKSFRLYADSAYDSPDVIAYPLFPGLTARGNGQPITEFRRILLRAGGNDQGGTRIRDEFMQELIAPLAVDRQASQAAVHFVNGEYWGLVSIRERIDGHFLASHHGVDPDGVAILDTNGQIGEGRQADRQDFEALRRVVASEDLTDPVNYAAVAARMDLDNFIRYNVAEIYVNNRDWPTNNVKVWRASPSDGADGFDGSGDGRWRWIVFDLDFGFGLDGGPESDTLRHVTEGGDWYRQMLRSLLGHPEFRRSFLNTFADHLASSFQPSRVNALVDRMHAEIAPYLTEHRARWRNSGDGDVAPLKVFGAARPAHVRQQLIDYFQLSGSAPVTVDTPDVARGYIVVNQLVIDRNTPGLPDSARPYPWTGEYFRGVPVTVAAQPQEGYRFAGWLERPGETASTITVDPAEATRLTAIFEVAPPKRLVHYWNFNGSNLLAPTVALIPGAGLAFFPGGGAAASDTGEGFGAENARNGDAAGAHLRVNGPIGATLEFALPTNGYEAIAVSYETRRSGQGAGIQSVSYSVDGETYAPLSRLAITETPTVQRLDFSRLPGVENNPNLRVRITFEAGGGGTAGNNRFDNFVMEGRPIAGINHPPYVLSRPGDMTLVEGADDVVIDLGPWFEDVDGDTLTWSFSVADDRFVSASVEEAKLRLRGDLRGGTSLTVVADDGRGGNEELHVRLLVYPSGHSLAAGDYRFDGWSASQPEYSYPVNALFVQSATNDPSATTPLDRPYAVGDDVAPGDALGLPYNNQSRTRINGLGADGVSFINTGRGRDVGGLLVALNTVGITEGSVRFTVATRVANPRRYGIRLQVRAGVSGDFQDVFTADGQPVVYLGSQTGPEERTILVPMPRVALDAPYVQFLWRYYHVSGGSGARTELRLDDVAVSGMESTGYSLWGFRQFGAPLANVDPDMAHPTADPFGRGMTNLLQYALDIHTDEDVASRSPRLETDPDTGAMRFRFPYDEEKDDVRYLVEVSSDLKNWDETIFDSHGQDATLPQDGWVSLDLEIAATSRFYRLRVEKAPARVPAHAE